MSAASFAALAGLVASGALTGLDQWAGDHLMPWASAPGPPPSLAEELVPLLHAAWHPVGAAVTQVVTLPGQALVSLALVALAARKLRDRRWVAAWVVAVGIELLCRHVLVRPALYRDGVHVVAFDSSWPSGHALRCALVAAAVGTASPRLRIPLALWLTAAVALLELAGFHTPTDLVGGLLLAAVVLGASGLLGGAVLRRAPG